MATNKEININGVMTPVTEFSHTAQEIDDATTRALEGGAIDQLLAGKAPAGYGLGTTPNATTDTSLNSLINNGWYYLYRNNTDGPDNVNISDAILFVSSARSDLTKVQRLTLGTQGMQGYELRRVYNNSSWLPWEWVNPPMILGVEYRTTERHLGKPVYALCGEFGSNINGASSYFGENVHKIVRGFVLPSGGNTLTPSWNGNSIGAWTVFYDFDVDTDPSDSVRKIKVTCRAGSSASGGYGTNTVNLYYTKNTD